MSEFKFDCPVCEVEIETDESMRGTSVQCPQCSSYIIIPELVISQGMMLGDFRIERRLGVGGMGEVWLAHQEAMDRKVAIKILSPALTKDKDFVDRFLKEVKMAGMLTHQNIVTAYHAGIEKGVYYLAIEFVDGVELSNRLTIDRKIKEKEALGIVKAIAEALKYAWNRFKLLHRDIKPANIMLCSDGTPKLMDMGISKSMSEDNSLTMTGVIVGTPYYMSPEQSKAEKDIDFRADVYSLGATLYHLVTGKVPFDGPTALAIISKHMTENLESPSVHNPDLSEQCATLIEIMMAKNKDKRQKSWEAVIADIEQVENGFYPDTGREDELPSAEEHQVAPPLTTNSRPLKISSSRTNIAPSEVYARTSSFEQAAPAGAAKSALVKNILTAIAALLLISAASLVIYTKLNPPPPQAETEKPEARNKQNATPLLPSAPESDSAVSQGIKLSEQAQNDEREEMWKYAKDFAAQALEKEENIDTAIMNFKKISDNFKGSKFELMANNEIQRLEKTKKELISKITDKLKENADEYASQRNYQAAAELFTTYSGKFAGETREIRTALAKEYTHKQNAYESELKNQEQGRLKMKTELFRSVADSLIAGDSNAALKILEDNTANADYAFCSDEMKQAGSIIKGFQNAAQKLADSLEKDKGKDLKLEIAGRLQSLKIHSVKNDKIIYRYSDGRATLSATISTKDLSLAERMKRLSGLPAESINLYAGLETAADDPKAGAAYFANTGILASVLQKALNAQQVRVPDFKGKLISFDEKTLAVELQYQFNSSAELEDWFVSPDAQDSVKVSGGNLSIDSSNKEQICGISTKAQFTDFIIKSNLKYTGNGFIQRVSTNTGNLFYICNGYLEGIDGYVFLDENKRLGPGNIPSGKNVECRLEFSPQKTSFKAGDRKWPEFTLQGQTAVPSIGTIKSKCVIDSIVISGHLDRAWYESATKE